MTFSIYDKTVIYTSEDTGTIACTCMHSHIHPPTHPDTYTINFQILKTYIIIHIFKQSEHRCDDTYIFASVL